LRIFEITAPPIGRGFFARRFAVGYRYARPPIDAGKNLRCADEGPLLRASDMLANTKDVLCDHPITKR